MNCIKRLRSIEDSQLEECVFVRCHIQLQRLKVNPCNPQNTQGRAESVIMPFISDWLIYLMWSYVFNWMCENCFCFNVNSMYQWGGLFLTSLPLVSADLCSCSWPISIWRCATQRLNCHRLITVATALGCSSLMEICRSDTDWRGRNTQCDLNCKKWLKKLFL